MVLWRTGDSRCSWAPFLGFPARAAEPHWTLPRPLPSAWDNLGLGPGLAQERDRGVAAEALAQREPLPGLENSTSAQKPFCPPPPPAGPSRILNPQPHWVHWAKVRGVMGI